MEIVEERERGMEPDESHMYIIQMDNDHVQCAVD